MTMMPLLTIVIPTRNRSSDVKQLLINLQNTLQGREDVEILLSDNSDSQLYPKGQVGIVRVIRSDTRFRTAEEHLFYALGFAKGEYVWPLGDDDIPTREGVERLLELCRIGQYEAMVWNCRNVGVYGEPIGWSRINCNDSIVEMSYSDFLRRMGYWSVPAGISLTVFKRALVNEDLIQLVKDLKTPIYSHVTLYALAFSKATFAYINHDLVLYRTNTYDVESATHDHWKDFATERREFYRFSWTLGFIRQLEFLHQHQALPRDFLCSSIDIGHFGHRLPLLEHMLGILLEQIESDVHGSSRIPMTREEILECVEYLEEVEPKLSQVWQGIRLVADKSEPPLLNEKFLQSRVSKLRSSQQSSFAAFPYARFFRGVLRQHFLFETPLGWLALPFRLGGTSQFSNAPVGLSEALMGIQFPEYLLSADTRQELTLKINNVDLSDLGDFDIEKVFLAAVSYQRLAASDGTRIRRIWNALPEWMKKLVRRYFL